MLPLVKYPLPARPSKWAFMKWMDIPSKVEPERVYLRRLRVVQTPWFGVYLHWIYEADTDRYPHDHPWWFCSMILRGSYTEDLYDRLPFVGAYRAWPDREWRRWSLHSMPIDRAHQITSVTAGLTTLVITGRRVRTWCFWTPNGLVSGNRLEDDEGEMA